MNERTGKIEAVLFDVGSTLIDADPDIDGTFFEVATARGHELELDAVSACLPEVNRFYEREYLRDGDFWCSHEGSVEMYLEMYRYLSHLTGLGADAEGIAHAVNEAYCQPSYWRILDDVIPCLKELKRRHLRLGIVSNWSSNLESLIRDLRLAPYFDEIVSSADVGYRKPDPMIFTIALERMGVNASETLHVGDRPDADGVGAEAAGIRPVIVDRAGMHDSCGFAVVSSLRDLASLLDQEVRANG